MSLAGIQPVVTAAGGGASEARVLGTLLAAGRKPEGKDPKFIRRAATQVVSQLFFAPLLAEMRKLPFGRRFATGGRTEEIFGEQLDLRIADSVAANCGGLTRQLVGRLQDAEDAQGSPKAGDGQAARVRAGAAREPGSLAVRT